jgi:subtilisin family serine protease
MSVESSTSRSTKGRKGAGSSRGLPDRIYAVASPPSAGGTALFTPGLVPTSDTIDQFASTDDAVKQAVASLQDAGFEVLQASNLLINIAGPAQAYERAFGARLVTEERPVVKPGAEDAEATFIDNAGTPVSGLIETVGTPFERLLEGVAIEEPYFLHAPRPIPPVVDYWHLNVPDDVAVGLGASRPHRTGITGKGIRVAMVDTGFQAHAFFTDHGYRAEPTILGPGAANPTVDEHGHGTGESANIFAAAPDVTLLPVKSATASGALVNVTAAFIAAGAMAPDIITNSWGSSVPAGPLSAANQALAAAVAGAVASGIVVVFSAGNGSWGFPGQHPDVISVGGVHLRPDGTLEASSYTSGFMSAVHPGRRVPDVDGLVGMLPRAMYIMLPVAAGCLIDRGNAGGAHPNGDQTVDDDGWAAFSGTSAAAPQIAGVCALVLQAGGSLTPAAVRSMLVRTARDVTTGTNHPRFGNAAAVGPDTATGNGLVDAHRAVLLAKLRRALSPGRVAPQSSTEPVAPVAVPVTPAPPVAPVLPVVPFQPPISPFITPAILPVLPPLMPPVLPPLRPWFRPILPAAQPVMPWGWRSGGADDDWPGAGGARGPGSQLSEEDIAELERFIVDNPDRQ